MTVDGLSSKRMIVDTKSWGDMMEKSTQQSWTAAIKQEAGGKTSSAVLAISVWCKPTSATISLKPELSQCVLTEAIDSHKVPVVDYWP